MRVCGLFLAIVILFSFTEKPDAGDQKAAFKAHYKGMLQYSNGNYKQAVANFEQAYQSIPENYTFMVSLALGWSRIGKQVDALNLLHQASDKLASDEANLSQKAALHTFYTGMVLSYLGRYGDAISHFEKSVDLQKKLGDPRLLSIYYNALGHAILLNQGGGSHSKDGLPRHFHVHKRDLLKSFQYFDIALKYDVKNEAALYNYFLLRDTLGMEDIKAFYEDSPIDETPERALPGNSRRALSFTDYDELLFLLDISGSMVMERVPCMGATRFDVMKETALFILDSLPPNTQIGLATIDGDCGSEPVAWEAVGKLNRYDMRYRLRFLAPNGTTPLLERLEKSPELFNDTTNAPKAIFLVSDGANVCRAGGNEICDWAAELAQRNIVINILTFLDASSDNTNAFAEYGCLAELTGGEILFLDNYRCSYEYFGSKLVESCAPRVPPLQRVQCWGPAVKDLWAVLML
ncbi:MAG TPA: VWA domain-containing protein [Saprospiraceae bacterium]|nr:VWA domain-containing protein [Saprospiraceae bacterium]HMQ83093.1 VWA domain-containing protein [Saprospiraceae bacterium]